MRVVLERYQKYQYGSVFVLELILTINVPLFKKLRDIIFFGGENHFMSHFEGHKRVKKVEAPSKCPEKWLIK
jgi:hypothetical protein